jgi:hypothetical protein
LVGFISAKRHFVRRFFGNACLIVFDTRQFGAKADTGGGDRFGLRRRQQRRMDQGGSE